MTRLTPRRSTAGIIIGLLALALAVPQGAQAMPVPPPTTESVASTAQSMVGSAPQAPATDSDTDAEPVPPQTEETRFEPAEGTKAARRAGPALESTPPDNGAPPGLVATADVTGFGVVGVTWQDDLDDEQALVVEVRSSADPAANPDDPSWGGWEEVSVEASPHGELDGTEPVVVGDVAQVQARVTGPGAVTARDLTLAVIDPGTSAADGAANATTAVTAVAASTRSSTVGTGVPDRPAIVSRSGWGADESIMTWTPRQGDVRGAAIHHTAGTNSYTSAEVPRIIRGIYAYHTLTRDWGDIGYNFLVDKFGRVWEGRSGGIDRQTIGGHAIGYNASSTGISVLGNYDTTAPSDRAVTAVVQLAAWKLAIHGVPAAGSATIEGTRLPRIFGHRDVASTACPGRHLYPRLGEIRQRAQDRQDTTLDAPDGTFIVKPDGNVALYENGRKHVAYCSMVKAYGSRCSDAAPVTLEQWRAIPSKGRLRHTVETPDGRLYWVDDGKKRQAFDSRALSQAGKVSKTVLMGRSALNRVPYDTPIVRPGAIVINRATGERRLVTAKGNHATVNAGLRKRTPLADLPRAELDRSSVEHLQGVPRTTGVIRRTNGREFILTTRNIVRIDGTGRLRGSARTQHWGYWLMQAVPRSRVTRPDTVFVRVRTQSQRYFLQDGVLHPVSKARARQLNGGSNPRVHEIVTTTKNQFPVGPRL